MSHNYDNNKNNNFKLNDKITSPNDRISVEAILSMISIGRKKVKG